MLPRVTYEMIQASPQVRAEGPLRGIVAGERIRFDSLREEALREVRGIFIRLAPAQPQIFVDRLPVGVHDSLEGLPPHNLIPIVQSEERRMPRIGKAHVLTMPGAGSTGRYARRCPCARCSQCPMPA